MSNERGPQRARPEDADAMSPALAAALRSLGLAMPKTPAEVAAAEARLARDAVELPQSLNDADAVLRRPRGRVLPLRPHQQAAQEVALENLARAARDGGVIPPDIEERMREDREKAERGGDG